MNIIPKPYKIEERDGFLSLSNNLSISIDNFESYKFKSFIVDLYSKFDIRFNVNGDLKVELILDETIDNESYALVVDNYVIIKASEEKGFLYGLLSLIQLFEFDSTEKSKEITLPKIYIEDKPELGYRGMHLDVSRHFFKPSFIKKYIDIIAFYKLNTFHWHLTDDNGWRVEIKKYPKLQKISAWRVPRSEDWLEREEEKEGEERSYGGYYTQEEIREIVNYAEERSVEIIPEIEMPGHSIEVLAAYPELGCFNEKVTTPTGTYWPNKDIFCAGKEEVFRFLEDVLDEVIDLFPSKYIHIGGDEVHKENWERCPFCQKRMEENGLKSSKELQSYFIKRMERFLASRGKDLLGWDEILEGGLAPNVVVVSWQGEDGGIAACKNGNRAIMAPSSHLYFDHYQGDKEFEPRAIGGYNPVKRVYNYNPIPSTLSENEKNSILGVEACLWTEWVPNEAHAEYMLLPRMVALAETAWCKSSSKNWFFFKSRLADHYTILDSLGYNHANGSTVLDISTDVVDGRYLVTIDSEIMGSEIYYSLGGEYLEYKEPVEITHSVVFKAKQSLNCEQIGKEQTFEIRTHKGFKKRVYYNTPFSSRYPSSYDYGVTDGICGDKVHNSGAWQGFENSDIDLIIDLDELVSFNEISLNFLEKRGVYIYLPKEVEISCSSDNIKFKEVFKDSTNYDSESGESINSYKFSGEFEARYIRVKAKSHTVEEVAGDNYIPKMWLFLDQVIIQ